MILAVASGSAACGRTRGPPVESQGSRSEKRSEDTWLEFRFPRTRRGNGGRSGALRMRRANDRASRRGSKGRWIPALRWWNSRSANPSTHRPSPFVAGIPNPRRSGRFPRPILDGNEEIQPACRRTPTSAGLRGIANVDTFEFPGIESCPSDGDHPSTFDRRLGEQKGTRRKATTTTSKRTRSRCKWTSVFSSLPRLR